MLLKDETSHPHIGFCYDGIVGGRVTFLTVLEQMSGGQARVISHRTGKTIIVQTERLRPTVRWPAPYTPGYGTDQFLKDEV